MMQAFPGSGFDSVTVTRTDVPSSEARAAYVLHTPPQKVTSSVRPSALYEVMAASPAAGSFVGVGEGPVLPSVRWSGSTATWTIVFPGPPPAGSTEKSHEGTRICSPSVYRAASPNSAFPTVTVVTGGVPPEQSGCGARSSSSGTEVAQPPTPPFGDCRLSAFSCSSASSAPVTG